MLRVPLLTVLPAKPTCSMYFRQLWRLPATKVGMKNIHRKYPHRSNQATVETMRVQTTTINTSSCQIRLRTFLLRIGEPLRRKVRRNRNGTKNKPQVSSTKAINTRNQRGEEVKTKG